MNFDSEKLNNIIHKYFKNYLSEEKLQLLTESKMIYSLYKLIYMELFTDIPHRICRDYLLSMLVLAKKNSIFLSKKESNKIIESINNILQFEKKYNELKL